VLELYFSTCATSMSTDMLAVRCAFSHGFCRVRVRSIGLRPLYGVRFRQKATLNDVIGSHACLRETLACAWPMSFLLGWSLL
jgi:hypothetical protein